MVLGFVLVLLGLPLLGLVTISLVFHAVLWIMLWLLGGQLLVGTLIFAGSIFAGAYYARHEPKYLKPPALAGTKRRLGKPNQLLAVYGRKLASRLSRS